MMGAIDKPAYRDSTGLLTTTVECSVCGRGFLWVGPDVTTDPYPPEGSPAGTPVCGGRLVLLAPAPAGAQ